MEPSDSTMRRVAARPDRDMPRHDRSRRDGADGRGPLPPERRAATIQDVATEAGVSRAAVSKVIRNAYGVSDKMRHRVEEAISRLDYRPRVAARAMRGPSFTLGIEVPQIRNEFHLMVADGAADALAGSGYQLIIAPLRMPADGDTALENLADLQVDGIIAISPIVAPEWLEHFSTRLPVVMVGRHDDGLNYDTVAGDDEDGALQVLNHLVELGHRHIAMLDQDRGLDLLGTRSSHMSATGRDPLSIRGRVYREQMGLLGLQPHVLLSGIDEDHAESVVSRCLSATDRPTAIFAGNDTLAMGALRAVAQAGLGAQEVSIAGYDNTSISGHPLISLTSVDQDATTVGQVAARLLRERIEGRTDSRRVVLPVKLVPRFSTTRSPDAA